MTGINPKSSPILKLFISVVDCIADLFGPDCEVVLHDISNPDHSIIKIRNGHITGRKEGGSITEVSFKQMRDSIKGIDILGNYNPRTNDGRLLKSNAVNIRDLEGKLIGIMCVNLDITSLQKTEDFLKQINQRIQRFSFAETKNEEVKEEHFESDLWSIIKNMIDNMISEKKNSVDLLTKEEKQDIINKLSEKGVFFAKGAIRFVAKSLGVSVPTIYRYLEETRINNAEPK
jgi:predicted transcriptional regulator YheO